MTDHTLTSTAETPAVLWRKALPALVITLLAILVFYRDTAMAMVDIWSKSETFTHGFLVPPISLWLIWRIRHNVARLTPRPNVWILPLMAGTGFVWLLGELATVGVVSQFALTTMLVLSVPAVLGVAVARSITFPLAFLFFAVPFGEFALPQMMEWTANFTIFALRLTGIPVFREGLQFVIPSGNWSVVEACSGVRYLIASFVVGTLFAYLTYQSPKRRVIFAIVSLVVPVVANWLRAYMIVMLGHLSGNTLAVGVDHLIYGWVFFGLVIMLMFWIGSRWREDDSVPEASSTTGPVFKSGQGPFSLPVAVATAIVVAVLWPLAEWKIDRTVLPPLTQVASIEPVSGWEARDAFTDWLPHFENPSAALQASYAMENRTVGLFIGYYRNQDKKTKLVSSNNVMVTSSDPIWARLTSGSQQVDIGQRSLDVRTALLRSGDARRMLVWQWYWINGHLTSSDYVAKAYTALTRLAGQGDDSAVVFVFAPEDQGETTLETFIKAAAPNIEGALNRTRERR